MYQRSLLAAMVAAAPMVAAQSLTVINNCDFDINLWDVVNDYGSGPPTSVINSANPSWSSSYQDKSSGGGASVKLKRNNNIFDGGEIAQIEYKMTSDIFYYDYSLINGSPFTGYDFTMTTSNPSCPSLDCPGSSSYCPGAYYHPDDLATLACNGDTDLTVEFCGSGSGSSSSGSSAASSSTSTPTPTPTPSSSSTPTPQPTSAAASAAKPSSQSAGDVGAGFLEGESDDGVPVHTVIQTTIVPVTVTKHVGGETPAPQAEDKREAHLHEHAHRHFQGHHYHA